MRGIAALRECRHYLAGEQFDALRRIQVAKDHREETDSFAHTFVQLFDNLGGRALDCSAPERQALRYFPLRLDFSVIRADAYQQLLRDVDRVEIAAYRLAVLLKHVELVLKAPVTGRTIPAICILRN